MLPPPQAGRANSSAKEPGPHLHTHIILNERLLEATRARVDAVNAATLHGRGVFTTLALHGGRPFLWDAHWSRLAEHARRCGVACDFDAAEVRDALARLVEANGVVEGRARVTLLARATRGLWKTPSEDGRSTDLLLMTGEGRAGRAEETLALTVSPYRVNTHSPLAGVKSLNYLEHVLAWEEARARGFDEAVVFNERGEVVSATMANLFWVRHGTVHTPTLQTGAVAGTTRARILELCAELAFPTVESAASFHDLAEADEIFLTSAVLGVSIVTTFDFRRYTVAAGSLALRLHEAYRQLTLHAA